MRELYHDVLKYKHHRFFFRFILKTRKQSMR